MIELFDVKKESWSDISLLLLKRSSAVAEILSVFVNRMIPNSRSGSLAEILENNLRLLKKLGAEGIDENLLKTHVVRLEEIIVDERNEERKSSRQEYRSFE